MPNISYICQVKKKKVLNKLVEDNINLSDCKFWDTWYYYFFHIVLCNILGPGWEFISKASWKS